MAGGLRAAGALGWLSQVAVLLALTGCRGDRARERGLGGAQPAPVVQATAPAKLSVATAKDDPLLHALALDVFPGTSFFVEQIVNELAVAEVRELHAVGSTSTVFRATLRAPFRAAFKAATHDRPRAAIAEVAAYRLARCLELPNVPPAVLRRVSKQALQRGLDRVSLARWPALEPRLLVDRAGQVEGAAIFWIEGMRELPLSTPAGRDAALAALKLAADSGVPQPSAAALSDLLVFDALIGNWDRWSGGNVMGDERGRTLYMRDNDAGFAPKLRPEQEERIFAPLWQTERFSRGLVLRLRGLTRQSLERELAQDPGLAAVAGRIEESALVGVLERRGRVLAHVQAMIDAHGEAAVLSLP